MMNVIRPKRVAIFK